LAGTHSATEWVKLQNRPILNRNSTSFNPNKGIAMKNLLAVVLAAANADCWPGTGPNGRRRRKQQAGRPRAPSQLQRRAHQRVPLPRPVAVALEPALQGGADYTHNPTGFYVGTWLSTIKWIKDLGGDGNVESTCTAASAARSRPAISYDVGGLYYWYPSNDLNPSANTFELYGQVGYGPGYIKYSHSTTNLFGTADSKQQRLPRPGRQRRPVVEGLVLNLHVGRQRVKNNSAFSYTDYKVGVTKDFGFASVSLAWIKANTDAYVSPTGRNLGKSAAVLSVSKTF
jgi:uncharacterized protein (TIGR02001 family)